MSKATAPTLTKIVEPEELSLIFAAIENYDFASSDGWIALAELSSNTSFESLDANPDGVFETFPGAFEAIGTVSVTLNFGGKQDHTSMVDSYPVRISGRFSLAKHEANIDRVEVDTSSFFG